VNRRRGIPIGRRFWGVVLMFLIRLLLRLEVRGEAQMPKDGAGIVYYNHIHWIDPSLISGSMRRYAVPLAKVEISRWPLVGWMLWAYHVIYITRGVVDRAALKATWDELAGGHVTVISPEGTRSEDGQLQQAKEGLAYIARRAPAAWLMPCAVTGTPALQLAFPAIFRRPRVALTYGRPFKFRWPEGNISREALREMTDEAMVQLAAVLPPEMRGAYTDADPNVHRWLEFVE